MFVRNHPATQPPQSPSDYLHGTPEATAKATADWRAFWNAHKVGDVAEFAGGYILFYPGGYAAYTNGIGQFAWISSRDSVDTIAMNFGDIGAVWQQQYGFIPDAHNAAPPSGTPSGADTVFTNAFLSTLPKPLRDQLLPGNYDAPADVQTVQTTQITLPSAQQAPDLPAPYVAPTTSAPQPVYTALPAPYQGSQSGGDDVVNPSPADWNYFPNPTTPAPASSGASASKIGLVILAGLAALFT